MHSKTETTATPEKFPATLLTGYNARKRIRETKAFKDRNKAWDASTMDYWQATGYVMDTMRKHRPQNYADWLDIYFTHCKKWEEVTWAGKIWAKLANISEVEGIAEFIIHNIDQSWEGYEGELIAERLIKSEFEKQGHTVREATPTEDLQFCVDFVVENGDKVIMGVQVKPSGFFYSPRINQQRREYLYANRQFTELHDAPVYYVNTKDAKTGRLELIPIDRIKTA